MTMRLAFDVNGVLRDTIGKFNQIYEQHMIGKNEFESTDSTYEISFSGDTDEVIEMNEKTDVNWFEYKILSPVSSLNLMDHFAFPAKEDLYSFMYEDYTMELFGHSPSTEMTTFNILNDIYYDLREKYDLLIVSDEIGKSKPATLFFLAKFGCLLEKVLFFSEVTKENMWNEVDILVTSNPDLILNKPEGKVVIKYNTEYNKNINCDFEISTLSEFNVLLEKIPGSYVQNF
jgi:hypothetical protein